MPRRASSSNATINVAKIVSRVCELYELWNHVRTIHTESPRQTWRRALRSSARFVALTKELRDFPEWLLDRVEDETAGAKRQPLMLACEHVAWERRLNNADDILDSGQIRDIYKLHPRKASTHGARRTVRLCVYPRTELDLILGSH